ncbi:hypothetical protein ACMXYX_15085 [Neptuniibacter sp. QD72_48]|uniref:hypothetical protein n=1 Tax=unclassified Neptuniibacter TaxID=2630693 RepID=UPI0039F5C27D
MRIAASDIALESAAHQSTYTEIREHLTEGYVRAGDAFNKENLVEGSHRERVVKEVNQSTQANDSTYADFRKQMERENVGKYSLDQLITKTTGSSSSLFELNPEDKIKIELLKKLFESMTGKSFNVGMLDAQAVGNSGNNSTTEQATTSASQLSITSGEALEHGFEYSYSETTTSTEQVQFQVQGQVRTADGRVIDLNLQLNMSRSLSENHSFQIRLGAALKDPLVINFSGQAAELSADTIEFDIDSDGELDTVHRLDDSSGYIALDKNNNGAIDNGNELFGAQSGNGFKELAAYDDDNNGFIDEGDAIWDQLRIWVQHNDGSSSMFTLADKDIGALYLGYSRTDWELSAGQYSDEMAGKIRATGLFLTEEGETGTLQQVDLVV